MADVEIIRRGYMADGIPGSPDTGAKAPEGKDYYMYHKTPGGVSQEEFSRRWDVAFGKETSGKPEQTNVVTQPESKSQVDKNQFAEQFGGGKEAVPGVSFAKEPTEKERETAAYGVWEKTGSTDKEANYYAGLKELREKAVEKPLTIPEAPSKDQKPATGIKPEEAKTDAAATITPSPEIPVRPIPETPPPIEPVISKASVVLGGGDLQKKMAELGQLEPGHGDLLARMEREGKITRSGEKTAQIGIIDEGDLQKKMAELGQLEPGHGDLLARMEREGKITKTDKTSEETKSQPEIKTGSATWRNKKGDQPIRITGDAGVGSDGRRYVYVEGSNTGVPLDEIEYPKEAAKTPAADEDTGNYVNPDGQTLNEKWVGMESQRTEAPKTELIKETFEEIEKQLAEKLKDVPPEDINKITRKFYLDHLPGYKVDQQMRVLADTDVIKDADGKVIKKINPFHFDQREGRTNEFLRDELRKQLETKSAAPQIASSAEKLIDEMTYDQLRDELDKLYKEFPEKDVYKYSSQAEKVVESQIDIKKAPPKDYLRAKVKALKAIYDNLETAEPSGAPETPTPTPVEPKPATVKPKKEKFWKKIFKKRAETPEQAKKDQEWSPARIKAKVRELQDADKNIPAEKIPKLVEYLKNLFKKQAKTPEQIAKAEKRKLDKVQVGKEAVEVPTAPERKGLFKRIAYALQPNKARLEISGGAEEQARQQMEAAVTAAKVMFNEDQGQGKPIEKGKLTRAEQLLTLYEFSPKEIEAYRNSWERETEAAEEQKWSPAWIKSKLQDIDRGNIPAEKTPELVEYLKNSTFHYPEEYIEKMSPEGAWSMAAVFCTDFEESKAERVFYKHVEDTPELQKALDKLKEANIALNSNRPDYNLTKARDEAERNFYSLAEKDDLYKAYQTAKALKYRVWARAAAVPTEAKYVAENFPKKLEAIENEVKAATEGLTGADADNKRVNIYLSHLSGSVSKEYDSKRKEFEKKYENVGPLSEEARGEFFKEFSEIVRKELTRQLKAGLEREWVEKESIRLEERKAEVPEAQLKIKRKTGRQAKKQVGKVLNQARSLLREGKTEEAENLLAGYGYTPEEAKRGAELTAGEQAKQKVKETPKLTKAEIKAKKETEWLSQLAPKERSEDEITRFRNSLKTLGWTWKQDKNTKDEPLILVRNRKRQYVSGVEKPRYGFGGRIFGFTNLHEANEFLEAEITKRTTEQATKKQAKDSEMLRKQTEKENKETARQEAKKVTEARQAEAQARKEADAEAEAKAIDLQMEEAKKWFEGGNTLLPEYALPSIFRNYLERHGVGKKEIEKMEPMDAIKKAIEIYEQKKQRKLEAEASTQTPPAAAVGTKKTITTPLSPEEQGKQKKENSLNWVKAELGRKDKGEPNITNVMYKAAGVVDFLKDNGVPEEEIDKMTVDQAWGKAREFVGTMSASAKATQAPTATEKLETTVSVDKPEKEVTEVEKAEKVLEDAKNAQSEAWWTYKEALDKSRLRGKAFQTGSGKDLWEKFQDARKIANEAKAVLKQAKAGAAAASSAATSAKTVSGETPEAGEEQDPLKQLRDQGIVVEEELGDSGNDPNKT